jgi:hypothetical protein
MASKNDQILVQAIRHELGVMGDGMSDGDRAKITELTRLADTIAAGDATPRDRSRARTLVHPLSIKNAKGQIR